MPETLIFRVVPHGQPAAGYNDDDDCDLDAPCDLVVLVGQSIGDGTTEECERDRRPFASGYQASAFLCELVRGGAER